ncbi:MAG: NMD3-related protein [Promethearchaeota archaeon]|jgi:NMD protein affecting ribosome stability and mRNA decay
MPNRFCAVCGKKLDTNSPHFGMCLDCYFKEHPLFELPKSFSVNVCLDCGSYSKKDTWIEPNSDDMVSILQEIIQKYLVKQLGRNNPIETSISFDETTIRYSSRDLIRSVEALIKGKLESESPFFHQQVVKLNVNHMLCRNCSNIRAGTYFVAILQLRVKNENQIHVIQSMLNRINKYTESLFEKDHRQYISKIEDQKTGIDLYLSTNELMNHLVKFLKSDYHFLLKRTKKLVGRDNQKGKNIYRLKTLIKFLPITITDVVLINDQEFIVKGITKNKVVMKNKFNTKLVKPFSYFFSEKVHKKTDEV